MVDDTFSRPATTRKKRLRARHAVAAPWIHYDSTDDDIYSHSKPKRQRPDNLNNERR